MTKDVYLGLARHILSIIGTVVISNNYLNADETNSAIGAAMVFVALYFSIKDKRKRLK